MSTPIGWSLPRFAVTGAEDVAAAVELQAQTRLIPLSQWGTAEVTRPEPDPEDFPRFTRADLTDARAFFTTLNAVLRLSPRLGNPMDEAMAGWLREIGWTRPPASTGTRCRRRRGPVSNARRPTRIG